MKRVVWIAILIASADARADEPPQDTPQSWSVAARLGAHIAPESMPDYDGATEVTRRGPSFDLEVAHPVVPRVELALFSRLDVHVSDTPGAHWLAVGFVGLRARMLVGSRAFIGVGCAVVREHEGEAEVGVLGPDANWGIGIEGELGLKLATIQRVTIEGILATGRFTSTRPEFHANLPWISVSLGARFQ